jgi:hypothetical protein
MLASLSLTLVSLLPRSLSPPHPLLLRPTTRAPPPALPSSRRRKELLEVTRTGRSRDGAPSSSQAYARLLSFPRWSTLAWPGATSSSASNPVVPALSGGGVVEAGDRSR